MRWPATWVCSLSLAVLGCPEVHRPGGLADKAAHRDALENIPNRECSEAEHAMFCENGKEDSEECLRRCGE